MYKILLGIAGVGSEILAWENVEGFFCDSSLTTATTLELGLVLFSEAVSSREKVPAPLFIHVPHIGFLASIFSWILTDQVHQEKRIIGQIVFLLHVDIKAVWHTVQIIFANAANETIVLQFIIHTLHLVAKRTESIDNETLNNGQKNDNDKEEETDIKENPVDFRVIAVGWFNNITNTTARSNALVQVEHKTS